MQFLDYLNICQPQTAKMFDTIVFEVKLDELESQRASQLRDNREDRRFFVHLHEQK